jgi:phenylalanyl-tRNA synthetase alpha chain
LIVETIKNELSKNYKCDINTIRKSPIVSVVDNYDKLYYPQDTITKSRYTHWVDRDYFKNTYNIRYIPNLLKELESEDSIYLLPGIVYRRDVIDRCHVGEPHQMDIWHIRIK